MQQDRFRLILQVGEIHDEVGEIFILDMGRPMGIGGQIFNCQFIKNAPENPVLWTGMKGASAKGRKNVI